MATALVASEIQGAHGVQGAEVSALQEQYLGIMQNALLQLHVSLFPSDSPEMHGQFEYLCFWGDMTDPTSGMHLIYNAITDCRGLASFICISQDLKQYADISKTTLNIERVQGGLLGCLR